MESLIELVEAAAAHVRLRVLGSPSYASPLTILDKQIAFVWELLSEAKYLSKKNLTEVYRARFNLESQIQRARYDSLKTKELEDRIGALDSEKRAVMLQQHHEISRLRERLFTLMSQRELLL